MTNEQKICLILEKHKTTKCGVNPTSPLVEDLGLDSLALMEVIEEVQVSCGVVFLPEDYSFENFATVDSLLALVVSRSPSG